MPWPRGWRPVDEGAVRATRDTDLLVRRTDLPTITAVLEQAGFVHDELPVVVMFRDGAAGKPSEAVHLLFSGKRSNLIASCPRPKFRPFPIRPTFP